MGTKGDKGRPTIVWIAIFAVVIGAVWMLGGFDYVSGILRGGAGPGGGLPGGLPGGVPGATPTPTPAALYGTASLQFTVYDGVEGSAQTATGNNYADIIKADADGVFNLGEASKRVTVNSDPEQSSQKYSDGDQIIIHLSSDNDPTGGTDFYDGWYYCTILDGEPIRRLSPGILSKSGAGYKITGEGPIAGDYVHWGTGDTPYWELGGLNVWPRGTAANTDLSARLGSTTLSSISDGSTWDTTAGSADAAMTNTKETIEILLEGGATNIGYGFPMLYVNSAGELQQRDAFLIFTTTMTGIDVDELGNDLTGEVDGEQGWVIMSDSTLTTEKGFYCRVPPQMPAKGDDYELSIPLTVDSAAATSSTNYTFKLWLIDFQLKANVAIGSTSTSIPTAYGMVGEFGIDAMIFARAYSTSSGAGSGQVLTWVITTPT